MGTAKASLNLDEELVTEARKIIGSGDLSSYVNRALGRQLQQDRVAALLDELDREAGPIDADLQEEVRRAWPVPDEKPPELRTA